MKKFVVLILMVMLLGASNVNAQSTALWSMSCPAGGTLQQVAQPDGSTQVTCYPPAPPTPTATLPPPPPTPTATPVPPTGSLPECPDALHPMNQWHSLTQLEDGTVMNCYFDHHHGDNPHDLDGVFGNQFYNQAGGSISYPWATFNQTGGENEMKHSGYKWIASDLSAYCPTGTCIKRFRMQYHMHPNAMDVAYVAPDGVTYGTRYHSFYIEAESCANNQCGILRRGGWYDSGFVLLNNTQHLPFPNDPPVIDMSGPRRIHYTVPQSTFDRGGYVEAFWYGRQRMPNAAAADNWPMIIGLSLLDFTQSISAADPATVSEFHTYPLCRYNGSTQERPHLLQVNTGGVGSTWDLLDGARDGRVNFSGYTDRYGNIQRTTACTTSGLDCVPTSYENLPATGAIQLRGSNLPNSVRYKDYEEAPAGECWISYHHMTMP